MMRVRPVDPAAVIRFPNAPDRMLPAEGADVPSEGPDSLYWYRRLRALEIVLVDQPGSGAPLTPLTTR